MKVFRERKEPVEIMAKDLPKGAFCIYMNHYHLKINNGLLDLHTICILQDLSVSVFPLPARTELVLTSEV